jgi:hypothetical protein
MAAVLTAARTPRAVRSEGAGVWRFSGIVDDVVIEGFVEANGVVRTGYPLSGPGVIRNPP